MELNDPDDGTLLLVARSFAYNAYLDAPLVLVAEEGALHLGPPVPQPKKAYYLQDRRFSVVAMAHESGAGVIIERSRYEAFGAMTVYFPPAAGGWVTRGRRHWLTPASLFPSRG